MSKKIKVSDLADVATKGGAVGVLSYLFAVWEIDPALNIVVLPALLYVLNLLSTKIGDPQIANFFTKQKEITEVAVKETVAKTVSSTKPTAPKKKKK